METNHKGCLAVIFGRSATGGREGTQSLDMQLFQCLRAVVEEGMEIAEDGIYREVAPGTASYRPALADFMKAVLGGEGQGVLVWGLDRLSRDARHLVFLTEMMENGGLEVIDVQQIGSKD